MEKYKLSQYRPSFCEGPWQYYQELDFCSDETKRAEIKKQIEESTKDFLEKNPDSDAYNMDQVIRFLHSWTKPGDKDFEKEHKDFLEIIGGEASTPIGDEELFEFQCGTSFNRALNLSKEGKGYTWLERVIRFGNGSWSKLGLQVSEINGTCRSEKQRTIYYAKTQAQRLLDIPVVITGKIKKKFVYDERNNGEYCIPKEFFSEIKDLRILNLDEYSEL